MFAGDFFDFGFVFLRYTGHNQVLVGGEAEVAFMHFGDFTHTGFQRAAGVVEQAAVFDEQGEVPFLVFALYPADAVAARGEGVGADGLELRAHAVFHFFDKHLFAHALDGVAGFGVFAVAAVAPVALYRYHGSGGVQRFIQRYETEFNRGIRIGFGVAVFHRQTAAHQYVEADQLAVFTDGDKVQIIGVQIDIVMRRNHHRGFEFARQIVFAQYRLGGVATLHRIGQRGGFRKVFGRMQLFAVQPNIGIGFGFRQQVLADFLRPFIGFFVQTAFYRIAGTQYVTVHVAGGGDGIQTQLVQPLVHRLNIVFQHTVKLEGLAVGETDGTVHRLLSRKLVDAQPLLRVDDAAGQAATQHHVFQRL